VLAVAIAAALFACSSAPGDVNGGQPLFDAAAPVPPPTHCAEGMGTTWTDLYRDCFGPGYADCGSTGGCHRTSQDTGSAFSGFLCGGSKDDCYGGMVGIDSLVPNGGSTTPEETRLYSALRKAPPLASPARAMPNDTGFQFTEADLTRIRVWIMNGAKND
jgi:hypothetical protein